jgi:hypothetical protein
MSPPVAGIVGRPYKARRVWGSRLAAAYALAASVSVLVGTGAATATAQDTTARDPCDPRLVRPPNDPLRYGLRGERCEGVYVQEVAGSAGLLIASFTLPIDPGDLARSDRLHVEWPAAVSGPVRLRAVALRRRLYYRMDSQRPAGSNAFDWPTDVLASLKLRGEEIGVVGLTDQRIGTRTEEVYVPLRVGERRGGGPYVVLVVPGTELAEFYVTLAEVGLDGRDVRALKTDEPLRYGYYPAETRIRLPLQLDRPGLYRLQLGATIKRGGSTTRSVFFQHAGR